MECCRLQTALFIFIFFSKFQNVEAMLFVALQMSTGMLYILVALSFLFTVPVVYKIIHVIKIQVNKIRNADIWGANEENYADEEEEEDED
eukprot:745975-Hanusia_phi.AAC.1